MLPLWRPIWTADPDGSVGRWFGFEAIEPAASIPYDVAEMCSDPLIPQGATLCA